MLHQKPITPMITRRHLLCALCAAPLAATPAFAGGPAIFAQGGIAIGGVDPVGYFTDARPVAGSAQFRLKWRSAIWHFASHDHRDMFERNPHRFAPRYGGFCAMSMSQGGVSNSIPEAWGMHEGRLYLTHSLTAIDQWRRDPAAYVAQADGHWPTVFCE
ncbi:YHS domain protein [Yoonia sp. F2084L]|uniref:YHS domain-containing (seleno)protein n=1 Tax=Yoonia sp. F2084L TaxID=2926419 RepID=UPI001FF40071|nr:YHS domain-containing (seleno)protein [Yoonia sp. F2084L]MCK0097381.1 YHS domain protein [Yoonia sp. F2084L]